MKRTLLVLCACAGACVPPPDAAQLDLDDDDRTLVVFVHGAGPDETPAVWADAAARDVTTALVEDRRTAGVVVHAWDWSARSASRELASSAAGEEGRVLADVIANSTVQHVHVVAHSLGAQVAVSMLEAFADVDDAPTTHATLLDPFSLSGAIDCAQATVCESWRNSDDGAPGSDTALPTAYNLDVTAERPFAWSARGHWWPTEAWRLSIAGRHQPGFGASVEAGVELDGLQRLLRRGVER